MNNTNVAIQQQIEEMNQINGRINAMNGKLNETSRRSEENKQNIENIRAMNNNTQNITNNQIETISVFQFIMKSLTSMLELQKMAERESILSRLNVHQIHGWTNKELGNKVFDSLVDNWNINKSVLNKSINGKNHLIFIIEDMNGNKFGVYIDEKINTNREWTPITNSSFIFSLETNGRNTAKKFEFKDTTHGYKLYANDDPNLISIGNGAIHLFKYQNSNQSTISKQDEYIDYENEMNSLHGETNDNPIQFTPKRIVVYQMEDIIQNDYNEIRDDLQINNIPEMKTTKEDEIESSESDLINETEMKQRKEGECIDYVEEKDEMKEEKKEIENNQLNNWQLIDDLSKLLGKTNALEIQNKTQQKSIVESKSKNEEIKRAEKEKMLMKYEIEQLEEWTDLNF